MKCFVFQFELIESSDDEMESAPCSTEYKMVFVVNSGKSMIPFLRKKIV